MKRPYPRSSIFRTVRATLLVALITLAIVADGPVRYLAAMATAAIGVRWLTTHWLLARSLRVSVLALLTCALIHAHAPRLFIYTYTSYTVSEIAWAMISIVRRNISQSF